MPKPDHNFRANPERGVEIFGVFNDDLVARVVPKILKLRESGRTPITVYINSNGGETRCLDTLHSVLKTKDADGKRSRIITVVVGSAGSAAATLLSLGDYSIAYPETSIHFHGVRLNEADDLTVEKASSVMGWLQERNDSTAMRLAGAFLNRLVFRYEQLKGGFPEIKKHNPTYVSDVECFAEAMRRELSDAGVRVVERALTRWRAIQQLSDYVFRKLRTANAADTVHFEAKILKEIVNFEIKRRRGTSWTLDGEGIAQVMEDYTILRDYHLGEYQKFIARTARLFVFAFLSDAEKQEAKAILEKPEAEQQKWLLPKVEERIRPFVYFAVSLCRHLHEKENPFTPTDAYWLGAVDEVYGTKLPCLRALFEDKEEQTSQTPDLPVQPPAKP